MPRAAAVHFSHWLQSDQSRAVWFTPADETQDDYDSEAEDEDDYLRGFYCLPKGTQDFARVARAVMYSNYIDCSKGDKAVDTANT